jgi:lysophospholipase L1-like esterase
VVNSDKSKPFKLNELDGTNFETDNYPHLVQTRKTDMAIQVVKVAEANKIPFENVVDSEKLLKADNQNTMNDTIHPNEHGYGILAQELYMRLAMSRNLKQRVM